MDAEQRRAEEDAGTIDSIALEAVGPRASAATHPDTSFDGSAGGSSSSQAQTCGANVGFEAASESVAVDGKRIDKFCDIHRLDVPARLKLFSQVCDAVHSAHQHTVIHRNLRPGNIIVTSEGLPKLINFGDVKPVRSGSDIDTENEGLATFTRTGEPVLATEYASPEQVMGETVTTASDIYTLGVILYELMTGRRPYHLKTGSVSEVCQAICEQVPEKPSALARGDSPKRLERTRSGDLDAIILMAMRKEPERRYASADQFADDLRRYLKKLPVRAHPDSALYRVTKFVRRHTAAVITGGLLILALVVGVIGITAGLITASRERNRAEDSFRQARQAVDQLFTRVSEERLLNQPGLHPLRKALLEDAQWFYEDFLRRRSGDRSLRAELALARANVARISSVIGSTTEAATQFEQAVALWDKLVAAQPANPVYREALARTLSEQGLVTMRLPNQRDEALRIFRRAQDLIEPLVVDSNSGSTTAEHQLAMVLQNIAEIERGRGQVKGAIENIQRSMVIEWKLAAQDPGAIDPLIAMAKGHAMLGQILGTPPGEVESAREEGLEPALTEYQQAVELLEKVNLAHPELSDQAFELALCLGDLSTFQQTAGKLDSALASVTEAVEVLERLERQYPGVLHYEQGLASTYNMISELHRHRREPIDAIALVQKGQTLLEKLIASHPGDASLRIDLAKSRTNLGRLLQQTGEPEEALRSFQRAIDLYESTPELEARNCYNLACNVALSIPLIGVKNSTVDVVDISKLSKGDQLRRERYGNRAVELLHQAVDGGFVRLDILRSDPDLDPVRDRPDFQSLIDEVERKMAGQRE
jgi:eukaryotic-like serine/threonine-protein kinase